MQVEIGLGEALVRAAGYRELYDPSPLVTMSLHRLLLAILHRAYNGPATMGEWTAIWSAGAFNAERLGAYLERWRHRFDLFDPVRPFYQVPAMALDGTTGVVADLVHERASGNNATLFDHTFERGGEAMRPAEAARTLVARQAVAYGGGHSKPFNFSDAPTARGVTFLAIGGSLFETLALNLLPYNDERPLPRTRDDRPAWERDATREPVKEGTVPDGYVDHLTWQSRRICLVPEGDPPAVQLLGMVQNLCQPVGSEDPGKCYRVTKNGQTPLLFREERALWRDATLLLTAHEAGGAVRRLPVLDWLARVEQARRDGAVRIEEATSLAGFGATTPQGKPNIVLWRAERLPLPLAYLIDDALAAEISRAVTLAEETGWVLWQTGRALAGTMLAPGPDPRKPDAKDVDKVVKALDLVGRFWPRMDQSFHRLLVDLPGDWRPDPEGDPGDRIYGERALVIWATSVRDAARMAFFEATDALGTTARTLKATAVAQTEFERGLGRTIAGFNRETVARGEAV